MTQGNTMKKMRGMGLILLMVVTAVVATVTTKYVFPVPQGTEEATVEK
jgi:flagellar basal body-associated protein FliL